MKRTRRMRLKTLIFAALVTVSPLSTAQTTYEDVKAAGFKSITLANIRTLCEMGTVPSTVSDCYAMFIAAIGKTGSGQMENACDRDRIAAACFALGIDRKRGDQKDFDAAARYFSRSCNMSWPKGCSEAAALHREGKVGSAPDLVKALNFSIKACDLAYVDGCRAAARAYKSGESRSIQQDPAQERRFMGRVCQLDQASCDEVAKMQADGYGGPVDTESSIWNYEKYCNAKMDSECRPAELVKYRVQFRSECDAGDKLSLSCKRMAAMMLAGNGGSRDKAGAVALFNEECAAGQAEFCGAISRVMFEVTQNGGGDYLADSAKYAELACTAGTDNLWNCDFAGRWLVRADSSDDDKTRARAMFQRGCDKGGATLCGILGELYERGVGGAMDEARAVVLYDKSCGLGLEAACAASKKISEQ